MSAWITQNMGTILVGLIVLLAVGSAVLTLRKNKKQGKSSCGCGCSTCPMGGTCHSSKKPS